MAPDILRWPAPTTWLFAALLLDGRALAASPPAAPSSLQQVAWPTVTTLPHRVLDVVPLPRPTANLLLRGRGRARRDLALNTICGYIGGNIDLPATCAAGSHCVLDAEHGAIGCCPNGGAACTAGVYTGCLDGTAASAAAAAAATTVVNPYVYTCTGDDVCYRNTFSGGYFQYGCAAAAAASTMVHEVVAAAAVESVRVSFTGVYATPSSPSSSSLPTAASTTSTTPSTTPSTSSSSPALAAASASSSTASHHRVGVIAGATIGSVAGLLCLLGLLAFFLLHRRRKQHGHAHNDNNNNNTTHRFDQMFLYNPRDAYGSPVPLKKCASFSDYVDDSPGSPGSPMSPLSPFPRSPVLPAGPLPATDTKGSSVWTRQRSTSSPPSSRPPSSYVAVTAAAYRASIISNGSRQSRRTSRHSHLIDNEDNNHDSDANNNGWGRSAAHHQRTLSHPPPGSYRQLSPYGDYPVPSGSEGGLEPVSPFDDSDAGSAGSANSSDTVRRRPAWV